MDPDEDLISFGSPDRPRGRPGRPPVGRLAAARRGRGGRDLSAGHPPRAAAPASRASRGHRDRPWSPAARRHGPLGTVRPRAWCHGVGRARDRPGDLDPGPGPGQQRAGVLPDRPASGHHPAAGLRARLPGARRQAGPRAVWPAQPGRPGAARAAARAGVGGDDRRRARGAGADRAGRHPAGLGATARGRPAAAERHGRWVRGRPAHRPQRYVRRRPGRAAPAEPGAARGRAWPLAGGDLPRPPAALPHRGDRQRHRRAADAARPGAAAHRADPVATWAHRAGRRGGRDPRAEPEQPAQRAPARPAVGGGPGAQPADQPGRG